MGRRPTVIRDIGSLREEALEGAIDNRAKFGGVLLLAPHCQSAACVVGAEPGGVTILFLGSLGVADLEEESLDHKFLNVIAQPGVTFWLQVQMKMLRFDYTNCPGLLQSFALGGLAVR